MSQNPFGVILATLVGIPMYADIFGTIPIAEAFIDEGGLELGTILSFMMAVTTSEFTFFDHVAKSYQTKTFSVVCWVFVP